MHPVNLGDVTITAEAAVEAGENALDIYEMLNAHAQNNWGALQEPDATLQTELLSRVDLPDDGQMFMGIWRMPEHPGTSIYFITRYGKHTSAVVHHAST